MTPTTAELTAIEEIAKRLDVDTPGWPARINAKRLEMERIDRCICGQLYGAGHFEETFRRLGFPFFDDSEANYSVYVLVMSASRFTPVWRAVIQGRMV